MRSIRLFLYFVVGLLLGGLATPSYAAATMQLSLPSNVGGSSGSYVTKSAASFSGAAFNSGMTTQVAGRAVTVPASWRLAANAGRFAVTAVRASPQALITSAVVSWLAGQGISYIEGLFTEAEAVPGGCTTGCYYWFDMYEMGQYKSISEAAQQSISISRSACPSGQPHAIYHAVTVSTNAATGEWKFKYAYCGNDQVFWDVHTTTLKRGKPHDPDQGVTVTEDTWNRLAAAPLPDEVASQISAAGYPLPLQDPVPNPDPIKVPLGDPYYSPVTKTWRQKIATITPGTIYPRQVTVTIDEQQVTGPSGDPVVDPATGGPVVKPQDQPDPCDTAPNRLACINAGDPSDVEIQTKEIPVSITPWGSFGAQDATCPADQRHTLRNGQQLVMSWDPVCQMATAFRPVIIGFAWVTAALIFLGIQRRNT